MTDLEFASIMDSLHDAKKELESVPEGDRPELRAMCSIGLALEVLANAVQRLAKR